MASVDYSKLRAGLKPPGPVLDVHVHPLTSPGNPRDVSPRSAAETLIAYADRAGVSRLMLSNLGRTWSYSPEPAAFRLANDEGLAIRDRARDRIRSFCYLNPAFIDESLAELERCVRRHGMVGVKLWVAVKASDPRVKAIAEKAVSLDVPILQHVWDKAGGNFPGESTPDDVAALAKAVPHAKIVMGHMNGGGLRGIEAVAAYPNVAVETGGSDPEAGIVEAAVRTLGTKRVIFGSDVAGRHFGTQLAKVLGASVSEATKKRILWDNLARLLPKSAGIDPIGGEEPLPEDLAK